MFLLLFENRALNRVALAREVRIATLTRHARRLATGVLGRVALTLLLARLITATGAATITRAITIAGAIAITGPITATGTVATTGAVTAAIVVSTTATAITAAIAAIPVPRLFRRHDTGRSRPLSRRDAAVFIRLVRRIRLIRRIRIRVGIRVRVRVIAAAHLIGRRTLRPRIRTSTGAKTLCRVRIQRAASGRTDSHLTTIHTDVFNRAKTAEIGTHQSE
ncbi:hypothetical protein AXH09_21605 [Pseudomonas aeruginosa]|nr:hypothetical protein AXH09_21605 [Pseudomonas aeruginosa]